MCNAGDPSSIPGLGRSPGEAIVSPLQYSWASLMAQTVKNPPAMRRPSLMPGLGRFPWRRAWQPTPVFLPRESPQTEEPGGLQSIGCKVSDMTVRLSTAQQLYLKSQQTEKVVYWCLKNYLAWVWMPVSFLEQSRESDR